MEVNRELPRWPEYRMRERQWLPHEQAASCVHDGGLRRIVLGLEDYLAVRGTTTAAAR